MVYMSNIDIAGFIVAVLGVITTILLGWNIYTLIDFKNKMDEIEKTKRDFRKIFEVNRVTYLTHVAEIEESISTIYGLKFGQYKDKYVETEWIVSLISAALHHAKTGNKEKAEVLIHEANEAIKHVDGQKLDKKRCFLLAHLLQMNKDLNLNGLEDVLTALIQIR